MTKFAIQADWDATPHLSDQAKADLLASIPIYQRDARTKGVPQLGAGAIYPVPETDIACDPIEIPKHWPRCYALDVGWNRTAVLWAAWDREGDIVYLYSEYYRGQAEPAVHGVAINSRGKWIPGVIDPAARGRSQVDGAQLMSIYKDDLGLDLVPAENAVEAGIYSVWERLSTGRLKAFKTLQNFFAEIRIYRRDEKGKIVKQNDHLMDDMRYLIASGLDAAITEPIKKRSKDSSSASGWAA
jgi:hypothetical protein